MAQYVPAHIMRHINRVAQAHLCRRAGVSFSPATRVRFARIKSSPKEMKVSKYELAHSQYGTFEAFFSLSGGSRPQWVLIAANPSKASGVPRGKIFSDFKAIPRMPVPGSALERILLKTLEEALEEVVAAYDFAADPHAMRMASAVIVGDIFYSSWGYDQTNLDYYQVVKTTPTTIQLRPIDKRLTKGKGEPTEWYMPTANKFTGPAVRKKLKEYNGRAYVDLTTYSSAYKWEGKAQSQTGGAYGH